MLTDEGRSRLQDAADAVLAVEDHMLAALTPQRRTRLLGDLTTCVTALETDATSPE